jgi:hypothetical protein
MQPVHGMVRKTEGGTHHGFQALFLWEGEVEAVYSAKWGRHVGQPSSSCWWGQQVGTAVMFQVNPSEHVQIGAYR